MLEEEEEEAASSCSNAPILMTLQSLLLYLEKPAQQSSVGRAAIPEYIQAKCHNLSWTTETFKKDCAAAFHQQMKVVSLRGCGGSMWRQLKSLMSSFSL